jgi:hypothetical protein
MRKFLKSLQGRTVRLVSSEEPFHGRSIPLDEALEVADSDLGPFVSGQIILRNERGDEYTFTFNDEIDE